MNKLEIALLIKQAIDCIELPEVDKSTEIVEIEQGFQVIMVQRGEDGFFHTFKIEITDGQ